VPALEDQRPAETFAEVACEIVRRVPAGQVVTYGQVAALAGRPSGARQVGYLLAALPDSTGLPWHRVINSRGEVSPRSAGGGIDEGFQRHLLEEEGIEFNESGRIDLERYRWQPTLRVSRSSGPQDLKTSRP
jgi:methylated-DNA-protein-cysteine methyltransferase-like protein